MEFGQIRVVVGGCFRFNPKSSLFGGNKLVLVLVLKLARPFFWLYVCLCVYPLS